MDAAGSETTEAFARGVAAGRRDARLDGHDANFVLLRNDVRELKTLTISLDKGTQRLADGAKSSADTAIALAAALDKEKVTAREMLAGEKDRADSSWTPFGRFAAYLSSAAAVVGTIYLFTR